MIGLTGGIATGKTTAANIFKNLGANVIDIDEIAREVVRPGTKSHQKIVNTFGEDVLSPDKSIDRPKLANLIFKDRALRGKLDKITHPAIIKEMNRRAEMLSSSRLLVIVDVPLLFETNMDSFFDNIIVVTCKEKAQIKRLRKRDGLSAEEARQRMASQLPLEAKIRRANFCIDNSGSFEETEKQAKKVWEKLISFS